MKKQQEKIKQLLQLINENPTLEIVPMVSTDCVLSDDNRSWSASWGNAEIDEYYTNDERIYFKSEDYEELLENLDLESQEAAECIVDNYKWIKCISVRIEPK